ncbi:S26 family signal peptidase [Methylosinus sp. R-45379]|uniref:S26 family signal peptidase n=1 Tax=Methylosinus sp. R-45379 TaxID=980563 RepID=UPI0007C91746|nr:S26 family signal peptidase [Methylosinus sp. R-45379]OAI30851.1 S26 family signal peptidase [Methylosinus sp. R-45379]
MIRLGYVTATFSSVLLIGAQSSLGPATPWLVWNATASTPTGIYELRSADRLNALQLVAVRPPEPIASFLADGGFLPKNVLLLKHLLAFPGQTVCRTGAVVTVDGVDVGEARDRDRLGRPLPNWSGCRTLRPDEVFLMNPTVQDSLDGRYFGPFPVTSIVARAVPIWTDEEGDGRFVWRAAVD